jgi:hypothetical protein
MSLRDDLIKLGFEQPHLRPKLGKLLREHDLKVAHQKQAAWGNSLRDFQGASSEMTQAVSDAYMTALTLKGMWDKFESIPPKQQPLYDECMAVMGELIKTQSRAYQVQMKLQRYR